MGDILNYFKYGRTFTWLTGINAPSIHSETFALEGHSFDAFISYMFMKTEFLEEKVPDRRLLPEYSLILAIWVLD